MNVLWTSESNIKLRCQINYCLEKKFGVDLVKTQIGTVDSLSVVVVSLDKKIIHSQMVCL